MGYRKRHGKIVQQTEPEPDKTHAAPTLPASPQMERSPQEYYSNPPATEEIPSGDVPPSTDLAEAKDLSFYTTRSGRLVKKPIRLDL